MITGNLKNKIDDIWNTLYSGGISNPLTCIEQINYLFYIKDLDDKDIANYNDCQLLGTEYKSIFFDTEIDNIKIKADELKWHKFKDLPPEQLLQRIQQKVFPFIKNMSSDKESSYSQYMKDAVFIVNKTNTLSKLVDKITELYDDIKSTGQSNNIPLADIKGDVYEYLLSNISTSGKNGQFRTPRHIIDMIVELAKPKPNDTICDPACGTCGFLLSAGSYLKKHYFNDIFMDTAKKYHYDNTMFYGNDSDITMLRISAMNMMVHGITNPNIKEKDSLSKSYTDRNKFSLVLANPPFKGSLDNSVVSPDLVQITKTKKTELLFLSLFLKLLEDGGTCACIVPEGVLFGSSNAHKSIRKEIIDNNKLLAVVSMPSGVFKPYAGVSTGILIFTKSERLKTDKVWFYNMKADGFSLDDKRNEIEENDIPDIIERYNNLDKETERKRTDQSFFVDAEEIREKDYSFSFNEYREIEYIPVHYPPLSEILSEIKKSDSEISQNIKDLEDLL